MAPIATKTIFLVRHGEALHNIAEMAAQLHAATIALTLGHEKGTAEFNQLVEGARHSTLEDEQFRDAPLSDKGKEEAALARPYFEKLAEDLKVPFPSSVLVSPLRRTLQTAMILFPLHPQIHVVELLRERRTSRPCDERSPVQDLAGVPMFSHMNFDDLPLEDAAPGIEDSTMLRERAADLVRSLFESDDEVMCLITHKAILRELERGPLGRVEAPEFGTCEVRVYQVAMGEGGTVSALLRYSKRDGLSSCHGPASAISGPGMQP